MIRAALTIIALIIFLTGMLAGIYAAQRLERRAAKVVCQRIVLEYLEGLQ